MVRVHSRTPKWETNRDAGERKDWPKMRGKGSRLVVLALLSLPLPPLWASDGGSLSGSVTDPTGAAISGASVTATQLSTAVKQSASSDGRGFYSFQNLPVGSYDVN